MNTIKTWKERWHEGSQKLLSVKDAMQAEITELREALRRAQTEITELREEIATVSSGNEFVCAERDALLIDRDEWKQATIGANQRFKTAEAKLSEAQEPVGEVVLFGGDEDLKEVSWSKGKMPSVNTKLYAAPVAPAQPVNPPHPDDVAVDSLAIAMKDKLRKARGKGRSGWQTCSEADLSRMLREHVEKGDPHDVANFCAFLHVLNYSITPFVPSQPAQDVIDGLLRRLNETHDKWQATLAELHTQRERKKFYRQDAANLREALANAKAAKPLADYQRLLESHIAALNELAKLQAAQPLTKEQVEKVSEVLMRYRHEVPLGHQPHMIDLKADEAIEIMKGVRG